MTPALFGILQLDQGEPLGPGHFWGLLQAWLQDAGGFAAIGLVVYLLYALSVPTDKSQSERLRVPVSTWMVVMAALALLCYSPVLASVVAELANGKSWGKIGRLDFDPPPVPLPPPGSPVKTEPPVWHWQIRPLLLMVAGLFALLGICEPFARDLLKVRGRRLWALAKLGFKEALRYRIHWVLLALAVLPFLFRNVWMSTTRPVDEFRTLVGYAVLCDTILILLTAVLLTSFSLPNDIKNQTIHTVVTKPVERFEVVLGRFLGYAALMTLVLAEITAANLILINSATIDEKAQAESALARVPVRGTLEFRSRKAEFQGTDVGREFSYRKYIAGHPDSPERAIWTFPEVPSSMAAAPAGWVRVEFTFDVFKMTKGDENKGAAATFRFVTHNCPQAPRRDQRGEWQWADAEKKAQYEQDLAALPAGAGAAPGTPGWDAVSQLAEKYGFYEVRGKEVFDYAVMGIEVPVGLFRNAAQGTPPPVKDKDGVDRPGPRVSVYVKCESGGQMLGMAEPDLFLLEGTQLFSVNFVKGMIGLWCRLCIVIGLAVACSTYLSGVLSLLVTLLIFCLGYFTEHLNDLATNRNVGGGPFESISRLVKTETPTAIQSESAGTRVVQGLDHVWAWVVRRIQNVIPDVESFSWTNFVSEGFNINTGYLAVNLLVTAGYLLPWAVLAYYLLKSREVAS